MLWLDTICHRESSSWVRFLKRGLARFRGPTFAPFAFPFLGFNVCISTQDTFLCIIYLYTQATGSGQGSDFQRTGQPVIHSVLVGWFLVELIGWAIPGLPGGSVIYQGNPSIVRKGLAIIPGPSFSNFLWTCLRQLGFLQPKHCVASPGRCLSSFECVLIFSGYLGLRGVKGKAKGLPKPFFGGPKRTDPSSERGRIAF